MNAEDRKLATLTEQLNDCWTSRDCDRLLTLLHDDIVYLVHEGGPIHRGPAAVESAVRPFMAKYSRIEFEVLRLNVIAPLVIHERTEHYYGPDGSLDTRFHVVGLLKFDADRVIGWRDYGVTGAEQLVGPICTQK